MTVHVGIYGFGRVGDSPVKVSAWHDNEMGYAHRLAELTAKVARSLER